MAPNLRPRKPLLVTEEEAEALRETLRQRFGADFDIESEDDPDFKADEELDDDEEEEDEEEEPRTEPERLSVTASSCALDATGTEDDESSIGLPASSGASTTPSDDRGPLSETKTDLSLPLTSTTDLRI